MFHKNLIEKEAFKIVEDSIFNFSKISIIDFYI